MANKRELKKFIRNSCGAAADEMLLARSAFPSISRKAVYDVIQKLAALQGASLRLVSIAYDKTPRSFDSVAAYRADRAAYYRAAYNKLLEEFDAKMSEIVKDMNAALPDEVRQALKEAASK